MNGYDHFRGVPDERNPDYMKYLEAEHERQTRRVRLRPETRKPFDWRRLHPWLIGAMFAYGVYWMFRGRWW